MSDTEKDYVGKASAGAATYDRLIEGAVEKLFQRHRDAVDRTRTFKVAFVDVVNRSGYEMGDAREQMFDIISTKINHFSGYETVSSLYVGAALKDTRLTPEQIFLPKHRRKFLAALEQTKNPAACLLFASVTSITTSGRDVKQINYRLTMELVDVASGRNFQESQLVRKKYTK